MVLAIMDLKLHKKILNVRICILKKMHFIQNYCKCVNIKQTPVDL